MKKIAVLIPCFDEGKTVAKVVKDFKKALPRAKIYVYDNNSTDDTSKKAKSAGAIVKSECRQGKGNVVRAMFCDIDADCYLMVDGDDTYPANRAKELCNMVLSSGVDMAIGDRLSSNYFKENKRRFHNIGNRLVRFLINRIFKSDIKDVMSGYRAFSRTFVKTYPVLSGGFEVETEMTIHALDKRFSVKEMPITYKNREYGKSKLNTFSDGAIVVRTIIRLFEECRPMMFFGFLAFLFSVIALIMGIPVVVEYFDTGVVPRFPTLITAGFLMMVALMMMVCGIILKVISRKHKEMFELALIRERNVRL